jgi:hypothetical protein
MKKGDELKSILRNQKLARLGDAYINFAYSLALTQIRHEPTGVKVSDKILAEAARKVNVRQNLPRRVKRGEVANAVESLLIYAWLNNIITLEETVNIIRENIEDQAEAFAKVTEEVLKRFGRLKGEGV